MTWIDGHLDLAYLVVKGRDITQPVDSPETGCISLPALRDGGVDLAFGTIFAEPGVPDAKPGMGYINSDDIEGAYAAGWRQSEIYHELESQGELSIVRSAADLTRDIALPRIVISMEGADPIRTPEEVPRWYEAGVRIVGMSWACGSRYAGGNAAPGQLTEIGEEFINTLDEVGIIHDVSHLSDEATDAVLELAQGSIIASHSNCRSLMANQSQRHLRDDQIKAIAQRGGIVGLNLYSPFLVDDGRATVSDAVRHVTHAVSVIGNHHHVALGSDMDGGFSPEKLPVDLPHPRYLPRLAEALVASGWSDTEITDFRRGNWRRFLQSALPK